MTEAEGRSRTLAEAVVGFPSVTPEVLDAAEAFDRAKGWRDDAVWIDPSRLSGEPCCGGTRVPVYLVVGMVWEHGVDEAMDTWDLTRAQVLNACWYAAAVNITTLWVNGGLRSRSRDPWRTRWRRWAEDVHPALWRSDYDNAVDPPTVASPPQQEEL